MITKIKKLFSVKMQRTLESTVFEVVAAALLIVMWVVAVLMMRASVGGVRSDIARLAVGATLIVGFSLFIAYYPEMVKASVNGVAKKKTAAQCVVLCRMVRVLAVELVPAAMFGILSVAGYGWAGTASLACVVLIAATSIFYSYKLNFLI